jgi:hypothetical protein
VTLHRREFLGALPIAMSTLQASGQLVTVEDPFAEWLRPYVLNRQTLDQFLDAKAPIWARFDPDFGYLLRNSMMRDGVDGSYTLARYESTGARWQVNFRDQPCRINTYGDSFTQGHQVSDGETWQEILAAHFCEPIRNFGVGGFGVYQAYRRLLTVEPTELGAKHIIFNIWGDDHLRSIYAWRWLAFPNNVLESMSGAMFHANPWLHARLDDHGRLVEMPNLCPTEASLYRLCELDFLVETFRQDEIAQLLFAERTGELLDRQLFGKLAVKCSIDEPKQSSVEEVKLGASALLHSYAVQVGIAVMDKLHTYLQQRGKELLVLLSYPVGAVWHACNRSPAQDPDNVDWHPQKFKAHLAARGIPLVDSLPLHVAEFDSFGMSAKAYVDRYYIGHYTPRGNHFFAFAIKDAIRDWLNPRPPAYLRDQEPLIRFKGYLPG